MGYVDVSGGTMQPVMSVASTPIAYAAVSTPYVASSPYSHVIFADASVNRFPQSRQPLSGASMPNAANGDSLYAYRSCGENPNALRPPKHAETAEEGRRVHSHASSFRGSQTLAEPAIRGDAHHRGGFQVVCAPEPVYRKGKSLELNSVCWHTFS